MINTGLQSRPARVKLFVLGDDNVWEDVGVGNIDFTPGQLLVIERESDSDDAEDSPRQLMRFDLRKVINHPIENGSAGAYSESILMLEFAQESYAISFKSEGFDTIQRIYDWMHMQRIEQLMPRSSNLHEIAQEIMKDPKTILALASSVQEYLPSLRALFQQVEEKEGNQPHHPNLLRIFEIVRRFVNDGDEQLLRMLISDAVLPLTLGALQYNPMTPNKRDFRQEFQAIRFHNLFELPEFVVEEYARPNLRLHFLRDCVIATFIEPLTELRFNNMCQANTLGLLIYVCQNGLLPKLVENFHDNLHQTIGLLEEICTFLKSTKFDLKLQLFTDLMKINVYSLLHMTMEEILPKGTTNSSEETLGLVERIMDVMASLTLMDAGQLELFLLENHQTCQESIDPSNYNFCSYAVYLFCEGTPSAKFNITVLLTNLLNSESGSQRSQALLSLVERSLIKPIITRCMTLEGYHSYDSLRLLCDFLGSIYSWMPLRVRRCIVETTLLKRLTTLLVDKKLLLATIRLMKILVESKDIHVYRYLLHNDLFRALEQAYRLNRNRTNLIESAFRNFFDCVTTDLPPKLAGHLSELFQLKLPADSLSPCLPFSLKDIR